MDCSILNYADVSDIYVCAFSLTLQGRTRGRYLKRRGTSSTLSMAVVPSWQSGQTSATRKQNHRSRRRRSRWRRALFNQALGRKRQKTFNKWKAFLFCTWLFFSPKAFKQKGPHLLPLHVSLWLLTEEINMSEKVCHVVQICIKSS